jgi:hypothetical protein
MAKRKDRRAAAEGVRPSGAAKKNDMRQNGSCNYDTRCWAFKVGGTDQVMALFGEQASEILVSVCDAAIKSLPRSEPMMGVRRFGATLKGNGPDIELDVELDLRRQNAVDRVPQ